MTDEFARLQASIADATEVTRAFFFGEVDKELQRLAKIEAVFAPKAEAGDARAADIVRKCRHRRTKFLELWERWASWIVKS